MNESLSPLIAKHLKTLAKDPRSRVFAQLAECYRKLKLYDKALNTLKKGIVLHPDYVPAYVELGLLYEEMEQFQLAYSTIRPLINQNRDNLKLQELFAEVCEKLELLDEALETYKFLLYVNPKDSQAAQKVSRLEERLNTTVFSQDEEDDEEQAFHPHLLNKEIEDEEEKLKEWVQVDLNLPDVPEVLSPERIEKKEELPKLSSWKAPLSSFPETPQEIDHEEEISPVITHTLVDLYLKQGYVEKARDVLNKILELHPNDQKTLEKIQSLKQNSSEKDSQQGSDEDEGQAKLSSLLDDKLGQEVQVHHDPVDYLNKFKELLQEKSDSVLNSSN